MTAAGYEVKVHKETKERVNKKTFLDVILQEKK